MLLEQTIARKTRLIFELNKAKGAKDDAAARRLAKEAAILEGQIAAQLLSEGRGEDAAVNLVSQASCLLICEKKTEAGDVLRQARARTSKFRLLKWIESTLESITTPAPAKSSPKRPRKSA